MGHIDWTSYDVHNANVEDADYKVSLNMQEEMEDLFTSTSQFNVIWAST